MMRFYHATLILLCFMQLSTSQNTTTADVPVAPANQDTPPVEIDRLWGDFYTGVT